MKGRRTVRIPASSSNLGPGFDTLGFALDLYLTVEVEPTRASGVERVSSSGVDSDKMPPGDDNLIVQVLDFVARRRQRVLEPARLRVHNEIPLARGLGSSAAAILAGISCYEMLAEETLTVDEIFECAREFEPHFDNLTASLCGGLTVSAVADDGRVFCTRVRTDDGLIPVLVIPEFGLSTRDARSVLPERYERHDAVFNIQRVGLVVAALGSGNWSLLTEAMRDRVHQPYRARLIPGLAQILELRTEGLAGVALSGAGPTVMGLARAEAAPEVGRKIAEVFHEHGVRASSRVAKMDMEGRRFIR